MAWLYILSPWCSPQLTAEKQCTMNSMGNTIQREWCEGEGQPIPVDQVETDWSWGIFVDCGQEVPVIRDRDSGIWF
jgi:hypothetical protein